MRHRHWFLVAAIPPLVFAYVFIRFPALMGSYGWYSHSDILAAVALSITCVAVWASLEIVSHFLDARRLVCRYGYSLRGVKCPECGKELG